MFIVSTLVPGRPVDTVQTTPRSHDATAGMSALGESTGPLRHLKIVSRPELDHGALLVAISRFNPCLESIAFELCIKVPDMKVSLLWNRDGDELTSCLGISEQSIAKPSQLSASPIL